ncbi:MAG TPA: CHAT domain-containing protein, partial [Candidatus Acetothermia bacterium]|nr:CHAT domain-containing protein [Candidatus Acetothermia bacterium]
YWLENTGWIYEQRGQYEQALAVYRSARAVYVARQLEVDVASMDQDIGSVYANLGRYEDALKAYQSAQTVYANREMEVDAAGINSNIGIVYTHLGLYAAATVAFQSDRAVFAKHGIELSAASEDRLIGLVYDHLGNYEEALAAYQSARTVFAKHEMELSVAAINSEIGVVYGHLRRYEEALAALRTARDFFVHHEMGMAVADVDHNIGVVYKDLGRYEDALKSYQDAISILDKVPPAAGMKYSYPASRWIIYENMGIVHEKQQEWDAAVKSYKQAIGVIESLRGYMKSEDLKAAWQERTQDVYERLIRLLIEHGQGTSAFPYAERGRARTFLDLLAKEPVGTIENVAEQGIKSGVVDPDAISKDVQDVITGLPADTAALEYFVTDTATYVWVIRDGKVNGPTTINHSRQELMNKVIETREQLGSSPEHPFNPLNLIELYDWLIRPVEDFLPKTTGEGDVPHLIIIPSGPLYYLPFQALIWTSQDYSKNAPLIVRYAISYSPSLATLKYAQQREENAYQQSTFLGLADPDSGDPSIKRLPAAQTEVRTVAKLFPVAAVYVDKQATEDVVQSHSATAREILLSTHGLFNPHNPMFSYLVVSPTEENTDGKLHAYEVFSLPLHADMVVLSACETLLPSLEDMKGQIKAVRGGDDDTPVKLTDDQLKELTAGDEVVGLTRAFISAGASSVLSSLWSVPSGSTSQLMVSFYKHMQEGMDKAEALRAAELEVMNTSGCTQPWYWAAFNLMGDWR